MAFQNILFNDYSNILRVPQTTSPLYTGKLRVMGILEPAITFSSNKELFARATNYKSIIRLFVSFCASPVPREDHVRLLLRIEKARKHCLKTRNDANECLLSPASHNFVANVVHAILADIEQGNDVFLREGTADESIQQAVVYQPINKMTSYSLGLNNDHKYLFGDKNPQGAFVSKIDRFGMYRLLGTANDLDSLFKHYAKLKKDPDCLNDENGNRNLLKTNPEALFLKKFVELYKPGKDVSLESQEIIRDVLSKAQEDINIVEEKINAGLDVQRTVKYWDFTGHLAEWIGLNLGSHLILILL